MAHFVDSPPTSACHFSSFSKTPALLLLDQTFSRPPPARTITYSLSMHLAAALIPVLPLPLLLLPFHCLTRLYYVACNFLPSSPCVGTVILSLPWVHYPPLTTLSPVVLSLRPRPQKSSVCVGPASAHLRFPRHDLPRQGSSPAACDSLPYSPLLRPPHASLPSPSYACPGSTPSVSVPSPRSLLRLLHRTRSILRVLPQTRRPLRQICRRPAKSL